VARPRQCRSPYVPCSPRSRRSPRSHTKNPERVTHTSQRRMINGARILDSQLARPVERVLQPGACINSFDWPFLSRSGVGPGLIWMLGPGRPEPLSRRDIRQWPNPAKAGLVQGALTVTRPEGGSETPSVQPSSPPIPNETWRPSPGRADSRTTASSH